MKKLTVFVNNESVFEYDSEITFDENQLAFLDKMDSDMENGIKIRGQLVTSPDSQQRLTFVAMNLIKGLQQDNQAVISSSCAYMINRHPELTEVHANDQDSSVNIELIYEQEN